MPKSVRPSADTPAALVTGIISEHGIFSAGALGDALAGFC
jgi:hypothetical protein